MGTKNVILELPFLFLFSFSKFSIHWLSGSDSLYEGVSSAISFMLQRIHVSLNGQPPFKTWDLTPHVLTLHSTVQWLTVVEAQGVRATCQRQFLQSSLAVFSWVFMWFLLWVDLHLNYVLQGHWLSWLGQYLVVSSPNIHILWYQPWIFFDQYKLDGESAQFSSEQLESRKWTRVKADFCLVTSIHAMHLWTHSPNY